jgi:hypothetical protein
VRAQRRASLRHDRSAAPAVAPIAPPAAVAPIARRRPARPKPVAKPGDAHITVASIRRCEVLVDGMPYGATPLIDLAMPAGKHTLVLLNSSRGHQRVDEVQLTTGQLWTALVQLRQRQDDHPEQHVGQNARLPRRAQAGARGRGQARGARHQAEAGRRRGLARRRAARARAVATPAPQHTPAPAPPRPP